MWKNLRLTPTEYSSWGYYSERRFGWTSDDYNFVIETPSITNMDLEWKNKTSYLFQILSMHVEENLI